MKSSLPGDSCPSQNLFASCRSRQFPCMGQCNAPRWRSYLHFGFQQHYPFGKLRARRDICDAAGLIGMGKPPECQKCWLSMNFGFSPRSGALLKLPASTSFDGRVSMSRRAGFLTKSTTNATKKSRLGDLPNGSFFYFGRTPVIRRSNQGSLVLHHRRIVRRGYRPLHHQQRIRSQLDRFLRLL